MSRVAVHVLGRAQSIKQPPRLGHNPSKRGQSKESCSPVANLLSLMPNEVQVAFCKWCLQVWRWQLHFLLSLGEDLLHVFATKWGLFFIPFLWELINQVISWRPVLLGAEIFLLHHVRLEKGEWRGRSAPRGAAGGLVPKALLFWCQVRWKKGTAVRGCSWRLFLWDLLSEPFL